MQDHPERIAVVVAGKVRVQRCYRSHSFPDIIDEVGSSVSTGSLYNNGSHRPNSASAIAACRPHLWINVKRDLRAPALYKQMHLQPNGIAMILLRLDPAPDESADERRLEESWRYRFYSGQRYGSLSGRCAAKFDQADR